MIAYVFGYAVQLLAYIGARDTLHIACVGDSITAGALSTGPEHTYPSQLQLMLDKSNPQRYSVHNLGASGATLMETGDSPYCKRLEYTKFTQGTWDVVIIMLGTNDAKDRGNHGPGNWHHDCQVSRVGKPPVHVTFL